MSHHHSIYSYPEHLNPFYEDDQHKRLRFWKISKKSGSGSRRGSFNLGSLRDLLPLKSFRLKKRSSALGISKTSESPPQLRRELSGYNSEDELRYSTYDPHFRHTVTPVNNSSNNFDRNVAYRTSLQNMNSLSFGDRSSRYRSTIQCGSSNANNRYMYSGSITPTPKSRYLGTNGMTPGSSMNSISTNPFDDYDEADINSLASNVSHDQRRRKKRRAPLPPVSKTISESNNEELKIDERSDGLEELTKLTAEFESFVRNSKDDLDEKKDVGEPSRLPASTEIKKGSDETTIEIKGDESESHQTKRIITVTKVEARTPSPTIVETKSFNEVIDELDKTLEICLQSIEDHSQEDRIVTQEPMPPRSREETPDYIPIPVREKFDVLRIDEEEPTQKVEVTRLENFAVKPVQREEKVERFTVKAVRTEDIEQVKVKPSKPQVAERVKVEVVRTEVVAPPRHHRHQDSHQSHEELFEKVKLRRPSEPRIVEKTETVSPPPREMFLKFEESEQKTKEVNSALKPPEQKRTREETPIPIANTEITEKLTSQGFVRAEDPIRFYEDIETVIRKKDYHFDDDTNEPPVPPERRRSVKDIIESINRNQKLLKVNQPGTPTPARKYNYGNFSYHEKPAVPPKDNVMAKLHRQTSESEKRINELLDDLQDYAKSSDAVKKPMEFPCNNNDVDHCNFNTSPSHDYLR